jgi:N-acetylneuraminic acid mutarotase
MFANVWVYEPEADRWYETASMPWPRAAHRLVALGGKIYVIGGRGPGSTALWVFDPATQQWDTSRALLPTEREHLAAGGKIFAIGGRKVDRVNLAVVEVYDPATDRWAQGTGLPAPRGGHTAATVNGYIHVTGGEDIGSRSVFADHWVYHPDADHWHEAPALPAARHGVDSAAIGTDWYVIGGATAAGYRTLLTLSHLVDIYSTP